MSDSDSEDSTVWSDDEEDEAEDGYKSLLRRKMEEEIARRVAEALPETPPAERQRRRKEAALKQQQNSAIAEDLNAHIDFSEDHRLRQQTERVKAEIKGRLMAIDVDWRRKQRSGAEEQLITEEEEERRLKEVARQYQFYEPRPKYSSHEFVNLNDTDMSTDATVPYNPNSLLPLLPHPNLLPIICHEPEPLYTSVKYVLGSTTYENQKTPYTHKIRGAAVVYDSVKSPKDQKLEQPTNPLISPNLVFESRFESGNLRQARRVGQFEYELVLNTDMFTKRHTQWYYFRIQNMVPNVIYKFRIINLLKKDSLYNHGMRPLFYSEINASKNQKGWIRHGHHISYNRNVQHLLCPILNREIAYYELEWQMEFPHVNDTCYLAHCYPFSYYDLTNDIKSLLADKRRSRYVECRTLCKSRAGHECPLLTITNFEKTHCNKKCILVSGRVHPGESNSSWMMKGFYDFLTSNDPEAKELRDKFVFKIVPMINPDGVVVGNYRCSLQARDLNRNYRWPRKDKFPVIWSIKHLVESLQQEHGIFVYCDFHGHSRKANVFMYGNSINEANTPKVTNIKDFLSERMLPYIISQLNPEMFSFESSKFSIRKCKESTGRVVMFRQYGIVNSFTMEATFSGTKIDQNGSRHYNQQDFMDAGALFARGVLRFSKVIEDKDKENEALISLVKHITQQAINMSLANKLSQTMKKSSNQTTDEENGVGDDVTDQQNREKTGVDNSSQVTDDSNSSALKLLDKALENLNNLSNNPSKQTQCIEDCFNLLGQLSVPGNNTQLSESSDSDSESEPEMKSGRSTKKKKKKSKKKKEGKTLTKPQVSQSLSKETSSTRAKKGNKVNQKSQSADSGLVNKNSATGNSRMSLDDLPVFNPYKVLPGINDDGSLPAGFVGKKQLHKANMKTALSFDSSDLTSAKLQGGWSNPYQGRSNGGIPCYSEERSLERAAKRMAEIQKKVEERMRKQQQVIPYADMPAEFAADFNFDLQELNSLKLQKRHIQESFDKSIRMLTQSCVPNIGFYSTAKDKQATELSNNQRKKRDPRDSSPNGSSLLSQVKNGSGRRKWHWYPDSSTQLVDNSQSYVPQLDVLTNTSPESERLPQGVLIGSKVQHTSHNISNSTRSVLPHARLGPTPRRPQKSGLKMVLKVNPLHNKQIYE